MRRVGPSASRCALPRPPRRRQKPPATTQTKTGNTMQRVDVTRASGSLYTSKPTSTPNYHLIPTSGSRTNPNPYTTLPLPEASGNPEPRFESNHAPQYIAEAQAAPGFPRSAAGSSATGLATQNSHRTDPTTTRSLLPYTQLACCSEAPNNYS